MFRYPLITLLSLSLLLSNLHAQIPPRSHRGTASSFHRLGNTADPFGIKTVFIENKGQYGDTVPHYGYMGKILFGYEGWGLPVLFTSRGLIYLHKQGSNAAKVITMEWLGANTHPEVVEEDRAPGIHSYGRLTTSAGGFRKLTFRNLYPGIDVEYSFIPGRQDGFEYRIIVQPGAEMSKISMVYGGDAVNMRDSLGSLVVSSGIDRIIETAPVCYYTDNTLKEGKEMITSRRAVVGKKRGFLFPGSYDHRRQVIIDPFVTGTAAALTGLNAGKVMQVDFDNSGDVYVQGGDNVAGQIAKFDPAGNLLWRFVSSIPTIGFTYGDNFGGWTVEKTTGNVYVGQGSTGPGSWIIRLNSQTGAYDNYRTPYFTDGIGSKGEIWKMRWYCNGSPQILIAGGSGGAGSFRDNIGVLLLPSTGFTSYNVTGITTYPYNQDVSDFVVDPANNDLYCILASGNTPFVNNRIYKNIFPYTAANQQWNTLSGYSVLKEDDNTPFMTVSTQINASSANTNATNILAVTSGYLFYYDGKNLKALDKATGATVGTPVSMPWTPLMQQGIFADGCNNVYIGAANGTIKVFRFNGTIFDDIAVPDIPIPGYPGKAVYALAYDRDRNLLYAGGDGFAASFDLTNYCVPPPPPPPVTYNLVVTPVATSVTAYINPALPAGAVVTYTLLKGTTVIGSNASGSFTNLNPQTTYTMQADIMLNCTHTQVITQFTLKTLDLDVKGADVCGTTAGFATADASGGFPPYTYSIDGINFQQNNVFPNLAAGAYTVTVKDASGGTVPRPVTIVVSDLTVEAGNNVPVCEGTFTQLSGTTNGTAVSWSPAAGLSSTVITNPKASPLTTTKYYFSATKGTCTLTDSLMAEVLPAPVANAGNDTSICYASDGVLRGSGGIACSWTPSTFLNDPTIAEPVVSHALHSVFYTLQVTDALGCRSVRNDTVLLRVVPQARVSAGRDTIISINQPLQLTAVDLNLSGFNQYAWTPSYGLNNELSQNPVAVVGSSISYEVTAVTPEGCAATGAVKVTVYKGPDIYIPNAFTPNGDGHNDVLKITAPGLKKLLYFTVFNRWGQEVFRTTDPGMGWNGCLKGNPLDAGTFVCMVEAIDYTGKVIQRKGTVLLIR